MKPKRKFGWFGWALTAVFVIAAFSKPELQAQLWILALITAMISAVVIFLRRPSE